MDRGASQRLVRDLTRQRSTATPRDRERNQAQAQPLSRRRTHPGRRRKEMTPADFQMLEALLFHVSAPLQAGLFRANRI